MSLKPQLAQEYLEKIEELVDAIVSGQQEIIALNDRRRKNKEALDNLNQDRENWIAFGNMFILMERPQVISNIKQEQDQLWKEIVSLKEDLKRDAKLLDALEDLHKTKGTMFQAFSTEEWNIIKRLI